MRLLPRLSSSQSVSSASSSDGNDDGDATGSDMSTSVAPGFASPGTRPLYETPPADGSSLLLACPAEILAKVFVQLDRGTFTRCLRLCGKINELLETNVELKLHHTLQCNSLTLNPHAMRVTDNIHIAPPAPGRLLDDLRERMTRFHNFTPKAQHEVRFQEPEGRLYEYLEGVLLRGVTPPGDRLSNRTRTPLPRDVAVYDLRRLGEWEDVAGSTARISAVSPEAETDGLGGSASATSDLDGQADEEAGEQGIRTVRKFDFPVAEFAVDPGQDLLVVVRMESLGLTRYKMRFHLLTLSTCEPHPKAKEPIITWPSELPRRNISLSFQICDDGLFVLSQNTPGRPHCHLCGWQWTTGYQTMTLKAPGTMSFESFVLLNSWCLLVPTIVTHLDQTSRNQDVLDDPSDLSWTHHLHLYAFPPTSSVRLSGPGEPTPPPHTAVHLKTIDLPRFLVDFERNIPPCRLSIRCDPPPRLNPPTHPEGRPAPFHFDPDSGVFIIDVHGQIPDRLRQVHYQLVVLRSSLLPLLPALDHRLFATAYPRAAVVIPWEDIAPKFRMFDTDSGPSPWVCFVYQNRFVSEGRGPEGQLMWRIYDFDPLRARKLALERSRLRDSSSAAAAASGRKRKITDELKVDIDIATEYNGEGDAQIQQEQEDSDVDGIFLRVEETVLPAVEPLISEVRCGSEFPYQYCEKAAVVDFDYRGSESILLLDESRIVAILSDETGHSESDEDTDDESEDGDRRTRLVVMEF